MPELVEDHVTVLNLLQDHMSRSSYAPRLDYPDNIWR
jgi:hypothetical protein